MWINNELFIEKEIPKKVLDIVNKKFGKLTVLDFIGSKITSNRKRRYYKCLCDCGNEIIVLRDSLTCKSTKSCGCLHKEASIKTAIERLKTKDPSQIRLLYTATKGNSKYNNREFLLTYEEYKNLILDNCHYCNSKPSNLCKKQNYYGELFYNGIDRVDSSLGYILTNCVTCCFICNRAKMDMSYKDYINYLNNLIKYRINVD